MKEIILFTMGTRGDVQPYLSLSRALTQAGCHVTIGTHPCWKELVSGAGARFLPVGPDIDIEYEAAVIRGRSKNPVMSMLKTMNFVFSMILASSEDLYAACKGKDLVIVSHSHMGATEAQALGIKTVNVTLQTEMIPEKNKPQTLGGRLMGALINPQMVRPYNKIRKKYSLPPVSSADQIMSPTLNLIPISRHVMAPSPYWEEKHRMVGYWIPEDEEYEPPEKLSAFLAAGERPVVLALGAMSFEAEEEHEKLDAFVNAFQRAGKRAVIQGFHRTLETYRLPETMLSVGSIPHSWLFPRAYCAIHHCGFGTTASALAYGVPSIPVPHVLDQFAFAQRIQEKNAGTRPVRAGGLSTERILEAIEELDAKYTGISASVKELSQKIREEQGLETSVALILRELEA